MALTVSAARILPPGQPQQEWIFDVILDGAATTQTGVALPANFPAFTANPGPAAPDGVLNTAAANAAAYRVVYQPVAGGTSQTSVVTSIVPNSTNPSTQIDIRVSAAGTNLQTCRVMAILGDQGY